MPADAKGRRNRGKERDLPFREDSPPGEQLDCSAVLSHHWLVRRRGGEKVLEAIAEILPRCPVYTLVHDRDGMADSPLAHRPVHTSFLQRIPGARRHYPKLLPLMPAAARLMRLPPVELVVCSDAAIAKAMWAHRDSKVVCYCHSPMRYVWDLSEQYRRDVPRLVRSLWGPVCRYVAREDRRAARRVNLFVANSQHVAERIRRHYGVDSVVVHPPVHLPPGPSTAPRDDYYVCIGYHTPYKRLDLAVDACRLLGRRLVVIGSGPDVERLAGQALPGIELLGWQPDDVVAGHLARAAGLLFPGEEDFGIVPVEAMAHGCPVVAYGVGGAAETIIHNQTGVLFEEQTPACLARAIERCEAGGFNPHIMYHRARQFGRGRFLREMRTVLRSVLRGEPVRIERAS
jgi:glycosyltransferase involved in cell wall biosynthesis